MRTGLPGIVLALLYCWLALEAGLLVRDLAGRRRSGRDRGTRALVAVTLVGAIWLGLLLRTLVPALNTPAPQVWAVAGAVTMALGLAVRLWAVVTLGRSFSTFLGVHPGQTVVQHGPYRWVRHPSYTGLWLIVLGFGAGVGHWLSLAACAGVPLIGLIPRIRVEEAELTRVLGDEYHAYRRRTYRLIPGVW
jgi:protein-S-isoprenylcysteine O-methyltransferase Ste14